MLCLIKCGLNASFIKPTTCLAHYLLFQSSSVMKITAKEKRIVNIAGNKIGVNNICLEQV